MQPTQNTPTGDPADAGWYSQCHGCGFEYTRLKQDKRCETCVETQALMDRLEAVGTCATVQPGSTAELAEVGSTLLSAAHYLSEHGWTQHEYYADTHSLNPAVCTAGALSMVCYGYPAEAPADNCTHPSYGAFQSAMVRLHTYIGDLFGDELGGVYGFNDTPGRTVADVLAILRDAALALPAPRCPWTGEATVVYRDRPFSVLGDGLTNGTVARVYQCPTCGEWEYVYPTSDEDRLTVRALYRAWVQQLRHYGDPHIAGTAEDCDTCDTHCFCGDGLVCVLHSVDEELSSASWHVPGQPTYAQLAGGAA